MSNVLQTEEDAENVEAKRKRKAKAPLETSLMRSLRSREKVDMLETLAELLEVCLSSQADKLVTFGITRTNVHFTVEFDRPKDPNNTCSVPECMNILKKCSDQERPAIKQKMVDDRLVPVETRNGLQRKYKKFVMGERARDWDAVGGDMNSNKLVHKDKKDNQE
jgi:hypothetical protein